MDVAESVPASAQESEAPPKYLRVTLGGPAGAENAGILTAAQHGYFARVHLEVGPFTPVPPNLPAAYVGNADDEIGVAQEPQVVIAREEGVPIIAVGSLIAQPTAAMIWRRESNIHEIADLKGKTIAVPGITYQERFLRTILAGAGLTPEDVTIKRVGYNLVPALVKGRADAIFGGSANLEGAELEARGMSPVVTPVQDLGIPAYDELVVIARRRLVAEDPQAISRFMSAVARGTKTTINEPRGAVNAIKENDLSVNRQIAEAQMEATAPLLSEDGYMDPEQARELIDWMREEGMIKRKPLVWDLLTNEYLP
jgi:putative hydroxymethylpyrimidine transport system substrate-binding protein